MSREKLIMLKVYEYCKIASSYFIVNDGIEKCFKIKLEKWNFPKKTMGISQLLAKKIMENIFQGSIIKTCC